MEITSGLRRMCLETTVMWENNTVLPERWLVSHSDYLSCSSPPSLCFSFICSYFDSEKRVRAKCRIPTDFLFLFSLSDPKFIRLRVYISRVFTHLPSAKCSRPTFFRHQLNN